MISGLRPYPEMKDSGVEWLGRVPAHWEVERLRNVSDMRVSNIDKHVREDEEPVRLCNYVDVYKNDHIHSEMAFMSATATADEIERFRLQSEDVLITKDSEAWDDIGVPAFVKEVDEDVVSGYHLALFRPRKRRISGAYLFRAMQSESVAHQFHVQANGVTRYGLSHHAMKSIRVPVPTAKEQTAIVRFLDHADRRIRGYIHAKERLIALMEEQKQAIIQQAATGRIDVRTGLPYCNYKDSSLEWLPTLPSHWGIRKLGQLSSVFNGATPSRAQSAYWDDGTVPWLNSSKVNDGLVIQPSELVSRKALEECAIALVPRGSVILGLIGQGRTRGMSALLGIDAAINQNLAAIVPYAGINGRYLYRLLTAIYEYVRQIGRGGNQQALNCEIVSGLRVPVPQISEQPAIVEFLEKNVSLVDREIVSIGRQVETMREYRKRLIADVVTGKFDVRGSAGELSGVDFDEHACRLDTDLANETTSDLDDLDVTLAEYEA